MRCPHLLLLLLLFTLPFLSSSKSPPKHPPHILIIVVDDIGINDLGFSQKLHSNSSSSFWSPHIDSLAANSVQLLNSYAHPTCTPSRAAMLTGRYAHSAGLPFPLVGTPLAALNSSLPTLPSLLSLRGYENYLIGKWHLGSSKKRYTPTRRGFHHFYGLHGGGFDHYTKSIGKCVDLWDGDQQVPHHLINSTQHATELFTDVAIDYLHYHHRHFLSSEEERERKGMMMWVGYTAAHAPLQADAEHIAHCAQIANPTRRMYCAIISQLDQSLHRLFTQLTNLGMIDDTLIVFTSDNGAINIAGGSNFPYRGLKSMAWEGALRVPSFVTLPSWLSWKPKVYRGTFHISDWAPSILSLVDRHLRLHSLPSADPIDFHLPSDDKYGMDGVDMLSEWEAAEGDEKYPRTNTVLQLDVFLNQTAYLSGCQKLILGSPGMNLLLDDPSASDWMMSDRSSSFLRYLLHGVEVIFDWVGAIIPPPRDQFVNYLITIQLSKFVDWVEGTSSSHLLSKYQQPLANQFAVDLSEYPPIIEKTLSDGPRYYLFDVCADPMERTNLASQQPDQVERIYKELMEELEGAPLQFAGDIVDTNAPSFAGCGPWLPDDDLDLDLSVNNNPSTIRLFARLQFIFHVFVFVVFFVIPLITLSLIFCLFKRYFTRKANHKATPKAKLS